MEARKKLGSSSKQNSSSTKTGEFKKITIQEESESDEEDEDEKAKTTTKNPKNNEGTNKFDRLVDDMLLEEQRKGSGSKLQQVEDLKANANELLKTGKYDLAIANYQKGLNILNEIKLSGAVSENEADFANKKAVLFNNIGFCYMQQDLPESVINYTSRVLDMDNIVTDTIVKAYLRRGKINIFLVNLIQ